MRNALHEIAALGKLMVLSPHLDDAVFACGELIAATPDTVVVTLFAGAPAAGHALTEWDAAAGFSCAQEAIAGRRGEDRQALALLHAEPVWMAYCDSQYGATPAIGILCAALDKTLRQHRADTILMPAGIFHSDHELAHQAALALRLDYPQLQWFIYEDALYRRIEGLLQKRLAALLAAGLQATPAAFDTRRHADTKRRAVQSYASQLRALATSGKPGHTDFYLPERYWRLPPVAETP